MMNQHHGEELQLLSIEIIKIYKKNTHIHTQHTTHTHTETLPFIYTSLNDCARWVKTSTAALKRLIPSALASDSFLLAHSIKISWAARAPWMVYRKIFHARKDKRGGVSKDERGGVLGEMES
jgi:hypothetical protein